MAIQYSEILAEGTIQANGTEQTIIEASSNPTPFTLSAWLDLSNIETGDSVTIKQYIKLKKDGGWKKYKGEPYSGVQDEPAIFVTTKPATYGLMITIEQTAGPSKSFDYIIFREINVIDRGSIVFAV